MVRRVFRNLDISDFRLIYKTYIRPHLEFYIQLSMVSTLHKRYWSPGKCRESGNKIGTKVEEVQLCDKIANVRDHATERKKSQRRHHWSLQINDRKRTDQSWAVLYTGRSSLGYKLRGHDKKLTKARPRLDIRKYFFSQRMVGRCIELDKWSLECSSKPYLWCLTANRKLFPTVGKM